MAKLAKISDQQIRQRLAKLNASSQNEGRWRREGDALTKEFVLDSFTGATRFISRIAPIANAMDHHPDLKLYKYKRVKISLTTHSAGGVTLNDFTLAAKIDKLASKTQPAKK